VWKKTHSWYKVDSPLVGYRWFRNFCKRNPEIWTKKSQKYARNREDHCNYAAFIKMYAQCEDGLVASGNAVRYEHPVHKDTNGKIVDDVSLAFGHPVTINYVRPENVFFLDETGDNAHGKDDGNRGGQRKVVPRGEIPKELVGVKDSHYTITPITNATGTLRFVTVIFVAKEVSPVWSLGVDIFAEWDPEDEFNMGPGKRHPGLSLISTVDGKDIPVLFAANPKASMTSTILTQTFKKMDEAGITQRGVDKNGNQYVPAAVFDGHISRMGEDFLRYINKEGSLWEANIGASYGTEYWQLHDDKRQNGAFKSELLLSKSKFYLKKRLAGLPAEILPCEIVLVVRDAIMNSFINLQYSQSALLHRGWNPYNRNTLDCSQILVTAPEAMQKERDSILRSRSITPNTSSTRNVIYSQQSLLESGSGRLAGGADAAQRISETASSLDVSGFTASGLMGLMNENEKNRRQRRGRAGIVLRDGVLLPGVRHRRQDEPPRRIPPVVLRGRGRLEFRLLHR
jgi:hypothetical protein